MALTSIIIPTHDRPELLQRAVESARAAGREVEVVVVDDGSTDDTRKVCELLRNIVYVRLEERGGVGFARARGIEASSGTYISFLDDDDVRLPGSIDWQVAVLDRVPEAALVYGQIYLGTQDLAIARERFSPRSCPSGDVFWDLLSSNFIPSGSVVVRRSVIGAVGGLVPEAAPADDWDLWLRIAERHPIAALCEPVTIYRQPTLWSRQGSSRIADGLLQADLRVLRRASMLPRAVADPRTFRHSTSRMKQVLCSRLLAETYTAARRGDPYAWATLRRAVFAMPRALVRSLFTAHNWRKLRERLHS
jgi:glycosyltransferase involved in cell wall biosynthesis